MSTTQRRVTIPARIGNIHIGAPYPVVIQSMTTTPTLDTEASAAQTVSLARSGAEMVRLTAQGVSHAANLEAIKSAVRAEGIDVPLVADIHFNPAAAYEAALHVEKVRINPGNFFDPGRQFRKLDYTDSEYADELLRLRNKFVPFLNLCRSKGTALRIGVNHGSLSDRIMSRFGDGAEGMVESALEFLRICRDEKFSDVVVSIKASDVSLMTATVRLLVERMEAEDMYFPIHLGVTEAGNALEGRIKSAVGIGSLLCDGIGDTIRVSLSEAPENEVPVARMIIDHAARCLSSGLPVEHKVDYSYPEITDRDALIIAAAIDMGRSLLDGYRGPMRLHSTLLTDDEAAEIVRTVIQAAGIERFKAEIVACPGCGRTLYELPEVLEKIKSAFGHLKHLKIAVMGCIVNGPGEMAGADYGYVGARAGHISLYRGLDCIVHNIPAEEAVSRLEQLIRDDGRWIDPQ